MKWYPPEFKADAVALYLSDPGRTPASVAEDLGISRETLRNRVRQAQADGSASAKERGPARKPARGPLSSDDVLEEENRQLKARIRELELVNRAGVHQSLHETRRGSLPGAGRHADPH